MFGGCGCCVCSGGGLRQLTDEDWKPHLSHAAADSASQDEERAAISAFSSRFLKMSTDAIVLAVAGVADQSGLFTVIADAPAPVTAAQIATLGSLHPRYVAEICACLACADILDFDKSTEVNAHRTTISY